MSETSSLRAIEFLPVDVRHEGSVAIVASGPSFKNAELVLRHLKPSVHVIAVKGAITGLKRVDSWITVDANKWCRRDYMRAQRQGVKYWAAVPFDYGMPDALRAWHRGNPEDGVHWLERIPGEGLSDDLTKIVTGNSAYAALGLAYHFGAKRVGLFGVDGTNANYGVGYGRPRGDLSNLHLVFEAAKPQLSARGVEVKNAGHLRTWPSEKPADVVQWLNGV